jgi:hypothetical protein
VYLSSPGWSKVPTNFATALSAALCAFPENNSGEPITLIEYYDVRPRPA